MLQEMKTKDSKTKRQGIKEKEAFAEIKIKLETRDLLTKNVSYFRDCLKRKDLKGTDIKFLFEI